MLDHPDPVLGKRFVQAVDFAVELHREQARKTTTIPYLTHLFAVCSLVLEDGGTEDEAIAALLHDGPEDRGGEPVLAEIRARFGDDVAEVVDGLSDSMVAAEEEKEPWRPRKMRYIKRLKQEPESVLRVSLADKLHNARAIATDLADPSLGDAVWNRFKVPKDDQAWYFRSLLAIFYRRLADSRNLPMFRDLVLDLFPVTAQANLNADIRARLRRAVRSVPSRARPGGSQHVYVALLRDVPNDPGPDSLYVGRTGRPPEVRYVEHLLGYKAGKRWIGRYGIGLLPKLTRRLNPMQSARDALEVEAELISAFRAEGFAVHGS